MISEDEINLAKSTVYTFDEFHFEAENLLLQRNFEVVPLAPKALEVLLTLVQANGKLITKQEILDKVWANTFVEEANLTHHVSALRKALGEDKNGKKFIETIPRRGYRFVAKIDRATDDAAEITFSERSVTRIITEEEIHSSDGDETFEQEISNQTPIAAPNITPSLPAAQKRFDVNPRIVWLTAIFVGVALAVGAMIFAGKLWKSSPRPAFFEDATRSQWRVTNVLENKNAAFGGAANISFAPTGNFIAFDRPVGQNGKAIFVKQLGGGEPVRLTEGKWLDVYPIWLADNARLAFLSNRDGFWGVWTIPFLGGTPALFKRLDVPPGNTRGLKLVKISADGNRIFYQADDKLFALDLSAENSVWISNLDPKFQQTGDFSVSPNDARMAFTAHVDGESQIFIGSLNAGEEPKQVTKGAGEKRSPEWFADGRHLVYASDETGRFQIYAASETGAETRQLTLSEGDHDTPIVSANGQAILFHVRREEANICSMAIDVESGAAIETTHTDSNGLQLFPAPNADNQRVAFQTASSKTKLFEGAIKVLTLGGINQTLDVAENGYGPQWSPAGDFLVFVRETNQVQNLWRASGDGTRNETRLTSVGVASPGFAVAPYNFDRRIFVFSPDGSQIAFQSINDGFPNLWTAESDGSGAERKWTANTGEFAAVSSWFWSPDGKQLAFTLYAKRADNQTDNSFFVLGTSDGASGEFIKIAELKRRSRVLGWSADGREIFVAGTETNREMNEKTVVVERFSNGGERREIARLTAANFNNINLSPDGSQIVFAAQIAEEANAARIENLYLISIVENAAPRRLTANRDASVFYSSAVWSPDGRHIFFSKQTSGDLYALLDITK